MFWRVIEETGRRHGQLESWGQPPSPHAEKGADVGFLEAAARADRREVYRMGRHPFLTSVDCGRRAIRCRNEMHYRQSEDCRTRRRICSKSYFCPCLQSESGGMPAAQGEELSPRLGDPSLSAFVGAYCTKFRRVAQGGRARKSFQWRLMTDTSLLVADLLTS